ncbi:IF44L protein, partial [Polypterus senegalus]
MAVRALRADKEAFVRGIHEQVTHHLWSSDPRSAYIGIKALRTSESVPLRVTVRAADGMLLTDDAAVVTHWAGYFEQLSKADPPARTLDISGSMILEADPPISCEPPSLTEIAQVFDPKEAKDVSETCTEQPSLADKVHCIVYVIDASVVNLLDKELQNKFDEIHEEAHRLGIPQLVLLAKVDLTCNIVKDDLSKVYQSRYIKQMVIKVSQMVGVPVSCILPVRNYSSETDLDMKVDILILKALQTILRQSEAFFDEIKQRGKTPLTCEGISTIPQLVLLTKIDEACLEIDEDLSKAYWSRYIYEKFNPKAPINRNDKRYRVEPRLADKVHCVVYVVEADKICLMDQNLLKKFKLFRTEVNNMEIPLLVLVTKIDEACPEVKKDLTKVYRSRYLYEKVIEVEHMLGAPISSISPIKNYSTETELNLHMDVLILKALQQMLRAADAYLDNMNQQDPHSVKQFLRFLFCRCSKT